MKFAMITTFFGAHSFGGDAAYVERLSQALCRRGHEVHVYYCVDAFNAVRNGHPLRSYDAAAGAAHSSAQEPVRHPVAAGDPGDRDALLQVGALKRSAGRSRDRRRALPQYLAGRRARAAEPGGQPPGRADHDRSRALADLPDAPPLEIRPRWPATLPLRELLPEGAPAPPGLAVDTGDRARACAASMPWFSRAATVWKNIAGAISGCMCRLVHLPYFLPDDWSRGVEQQPPADTRAALPRRGRTAGEDEGISAPDSD